MRPEHVGMNGTQRELERTVQLFAIARDLTWWQRAYLGRVLAMLRRGS